MGKKVEPAIIKDGIVSYIDNDGKQINLEVEKALDHLSELREENKTRRFDGKEKDDQITDLKSELDTFKDVDLEKYKKLLSGKGDKNNDANDQVVALQAQLEALKTGATEWETKYSTLGSEFLGFRNKSKINEAFNRSNFVKNRFITSDASIAQAMLGEYFTITEDGQIEGKINGQTVYSTKDGKVASFDEALEKIIESHPSKNELLRAETKIRQQFIDEGVKGPSVRGIGSIKAGLSKRV